MPVARGIVLDDATGMAAGGASVTISAIGLGLSFSGISDAQGRFSVDIPAEALNSEKLFAFHFGATWHDSEGMTFVEPTQVARDDNEIRVFAKAGFTGTVKDELGSPIPNCSVKASWMETHEEYQRSGSETRRNFISKAGERYFLEFPYTLPAPLSVNAAGAYSISDLRPGAWRLAFLDDLGVEVAAMGRLLPGQTRRYDIVMPRPLYQVRGTLKDVRGNPVAGQRLDFRNGSKHFLSTLDGVPIESCAMRFPDNLIQFSVQTDDKGEFHASAVDRRLIRIVSSRMNKNVRVANPGPYELERDKAVSVDLILVDRLRLSGVILDAQTRMPIDQTQAEIWLLVRLVDTEGVQHQTDQFDVKEDGSFVGYVDLPGPYAFEATHVPHYARTWLRSVIAPADGLEILMQPE